MSLSNNRHRLSICRRSRRGSIVVLAAVLLVVVAVVLALAVDVGIMMSAQTDLQLAVDSGALAGAGAMGEGPVGAEAAAIIYVQSNPVANTIVKTGDMEVELGQWDYTTKTFQRDPSHPFAVRVVAHPASLPLFFSRIMGRKDYNLQAEAIAVYRPRDIMIVLDCSSSMNNDSEFQKFSRLGRATIEANQLQIYRELGSPQFGNMQWKPRYISTSDTNRVIRQLGLDSVPYPYPSGSWEDYVRYVKSDYWVNRSGYHKKYGYFTLVQYWLTRQPLGHQTPDLWKTSEQPITAVKDAVTIFLAYLQQVATDDQVGLAVYTHPDNGAHLEMGLTHDMALVEQSTRERQAGHYLHMTNIGAGMREARQELEKNARTSTLKMIVLLTDGRTNQPSGNALGLVRSEARLCAEKGYPIITISLGSGADISLMQEVADGTEGVHFNIPGGQAVADYEEQLKEVFREIAAQRPLELVN